MILDNVRTVCGQFCGIFGVFFAIVGPILHQRCLSQVVPVCLVPEIALPRACCADDFGWFGHGCSFNSCLREIGVRRSSTFVQTLSANGMVSRI